MAVTPYAPDSQATPVKLSEPWSVAVSCTNSATTTACMGIGQFAMGCVRVPNGSSITSITWYSRFDRTDTPVALKDQDGVAVTQTVAADEVHEVPSAVAGLTFAIPVTDASGTLQFTWKR